MTWNDAQARLQDSVFERLGVDADWDGVSNPVRVILRDGEQIINMEVDDRVTVRVRSSEVLDPAKGDTFTVGTQGYALIGKPVLDRNGTWRGEAKAT